MTEPTYRLRRGTPADSRAAFDVFLPAVRDLAARQGNPWDPDPEALWPRMQPLLDRLATHAAEWWIAEDAASGEVIGYARSVERGGLFELSEFFVHPDRQSAGVGGALLDAAFPADRGEVRAIIATTDVRALRRYHAAGTFAQFLAQKGYTVVSVMPAHTKRTKEIEDNSPNKNDDKDAWKKFFDRRVVVTGLADNARVEIVSGLKAGEEIALEDPAVSKDADEDDD